LPVREVDAHAVRVAVAGLDLARRKVDVENAHELVLQRHSMRVGGHAHGIERVVRRLGKDQTAGQDGGPDGHREQRLLLRHTVSFSLGRVAGRTATLTTAPMRALARAHTSSSTSRKCRRMRGTIALANGTPSSTASTAAPLWPDRSSASNRSPFAFTARSRRGRIAGGG